MSIWIVYESLWGNTEAVAHAFLDIVSFLGYAYLAGRVSWL